MLDCRVTDCRLWRSFESTEPKHGYCADPQMWACSMRAKERLENETKKSEPTDAR